MCGFSGHVTPSGACSPDSEPDPDVGCPNAGDVTGSTCSLWQRAQYTGWWQYAQDWLPCSRITAAWFVAISSCPIEIAPVEWQFTQ